MQTRVIGMMKLFNFASIGTPFLETLQQITNKIKAKPILTKRLLGKTFIVPANIDAVNIREIVMQTIENNFEELSLLSAFSPKLKKA